MIQGNTSQGAVLMGPGVVKHAGTGYITIAAPTPVQLHVEELTIERTERGRVVGEDPELHSSPCSAC